MVICLHRLLFIMAKIYLGNAMKKILLASMTCAFVLTGCQSGTPIPYPSVVQNIQRNVTTEQQVRQMYGEPTAVYMNAQSGVKTLIYRHNASDEVKRPIAGVVGTVAGGALGHQIGGGFGQALATMVGGVAGGALASNAVTTRSKNETLTVEISMATGRVVNYQYTESGNRSQPWYPSAGVGTL